MTSKNKNNDTNEWVQWIEDGIARDYINYHDYGEFQNIVNVGDGGFRKAYRANLGSSNTVVALKSLTSPHGDNDPMKEIVREIMSLNKVNYHTNINQFIGVTKGENSIYSLILEYADSGTLFDYLKDNFYKLNWNIKLQFAIQIAGAVSFMHHKDIIHRNLHPDNILVHQNKIKLAGFGLSCRLNEVSIDKNNFGVGPFVDPQYFKIYHRYKENKKSDVYSIGVLLWVISSGRGPFESYDYYDVELLMRITNGLRETPIPDAPIDYVDIHTRCWQENPDDRPDMQKVLSGLKLIKLENERINSENNILDANNEVNSHLNLLNLPFTSLRQYHKTNIYPSKRISKRISHDNSELCFKEFSPLDDKEIQTEIKKQVDIFEELKIFDHIIRFYGVAKDESKYYLITEWMEHGNLHEYYTRFRDNINLETKIKFALNICRGVEYLHSCQIFHQDIQSANILVNEDHKVKIANFGLSKKFSDITQNNLHDLENIRYLAPEKFILLFESNGEKVPYDSKCEIYSVGILLWELFELKKPYSDFNKSELLVSIKKRVSKGFCLPFSDYVPGEWKDIVSRAIEFEPMLRPDISDICRDLQSLSKKCLDLDVDENVKKWVEKHKVKSIRWSEFNSAENIGSGRFGSVSKVYWTKSHSYVACKKLTVSADIQCRMWEAFKHELGMQIRAHNCENIVRIFGISKNLNDEYVIVMEYADEGNLTKYLSNNFEHLGWRKKFRLALDITKGLHYLHKEDILHRDLHAGNIVIHQGKAKITDFGHSKSMNTATNMHESVFGNYPYVSPEVIMANKAKQDPYTKYSDVYSLGVLLWQISSGKPPFENRNRYAIILSVASGFREERMPNTPDGYYDLYNRCWVDEPEKRHSIEYVYDTLENLFKDEKVGKTDGDEVKEENVDDVEKLGNKGTSNFIVNWVNLTTNDK